MFSLVPARPKDLDTSTQYPVRMKLSEWNLSFRSKGPAAQWNIQLPTEQAMRRCFGSGTSRKSGNGNHWKPQLWSNGLTILDADSTLPQRQQYSLRKCLDTVKSWWGAKALLNNHPSADCLRWQKMDKNLWKFMDIQHVLLQVPRARHALGTLPRKAFGVPSGQWLSECPHRANKPQRPEIDL